MKKLLFLFFFFCGSLYSQEGDILGTWYVRGEKAKVEIYKVGEKYHGKLVWLLEPYHKDGTLKVDILNPDPEKKGRDVIGMDILENLKKKGSNYWSGGTIYDPERGKSYRCHIKLKGETLEVRGYIGFSWFGKTEVWTKAP
jgi:uncharacterized protein (DUF2147 family)